MPSQPHSVTPRGPLRAVGAPRPSAVRARTRRRRTISAIVIVVLVALTGAVAFAALQGASRVTEPQLTPPPADESATPEPDASASAAPDSPDGATPAVTEVEVEGQTVSWIAPDEPRGVAVLLPDGGESAANLITNAASSALFAQGWAVVSADFGGQSWGSPASSDAVATVRAWSDAEWTDLPVAYVAAGTGATTAIMAMSRVPATPVSCVYTAAPVTDLVAAVGADASLAARIAAAWGRTPTPDDNPILVVPDLSTSSTYRVVIPDAPDSRAEDATTFASTLEATGHSVTSTTAAGANWASLTPDLTAFTEGCLA